MKNHRNNSHSVFIILLLCCFSSVMIVNGQPGQWKSYLSYYNTVKVVETPQKIFAVATPSPNASINALVCGALYAYSPDYREVKKYSKADGLNDINIVHLAYSEREDALLIIYESSNIDIFTSSGIYNLPYIKDHTNYSNKTIYDVSIYGRYAYLSAAFGIVVIDMQEREVKATYRLDGNVYSVCIKDEHIYASTSVGILYAQLSKDLISKDNWSPYNPGIEGLDVNDVQKIFAFRDALVFCQYNNGIFYEKEEEKKRLLSGALKKVTIAGDQLIGISYERAYFWNDLNENDFSTLNDPNIYDVGGGNRNIYWIAQGVKGLSAIKKEHSSNESEQQTNISINSPKNNHCFSVTFQQNKLLVTGGGREAQRNNTPGTLMVLEEDGTWFNFDESKIEQAIRSGYPEIPNYRCTDFIEAAVDPRDPQHYFVSTYGDGLLEFRNNEFVQLHNKEPSTLFSLVPGDYGLICVGGLRFDADNNLYIASIVRASGKTNPLHLLTNDGKWYNFPYNLGAYTFPSGDVIITSDNQKWINFPRNANSSSGVFIVDDNGTLTDPSDDRTASFFGKFTDQKGELFSFTKCLSIAEDQQGTIWVGTDQGPILFHNPQNAIKDPNNFYCTRLILPYNDGTGNGYYLLASEQINSIAVDGANRKWLGTESSGVYLVSETGMEILQHFTAEDSPLISNKIKQIAINPQSGEVFIATDKGLVSYMSNASEGKPDYKEVRVYPNPVRPEYDHWVTVSDLIKDSNVKITDMRGNLIYQGISKGGMFTWNCTNKDGTRVKTGVYLVFAATAEGTEGVVAKVTVVK